MTSCETTSNNTTVEIKSKCWSKSKDRYHVVYNYPSSEIGTLVNNIMGDTISISTGEKSFLTQDLGSDTNTLSINIVGGDVITAELSSTDTFSATFTPDVGVPASITLTEAPVGTFNGSQVSGANTYDLSYDSASKILTITVSDGVSVINTITANMITFIITMA